MHYLSACHSFAYRFNKWKKRSQRQESEAHLLVDIPKGGDRGCVTDNETSRNVTVLLTNHHPFYSVLAISG